MRGSKLFNILLLALLLFASALNLHQYLQTGDLNHLVLLAVTMALFLVNLVEVLRLSK